MNASESVCRVNVPNDDGNIDDTETQLIFCYKQLNQIMGFCFVECYRFYFMMVALFFLVQTLNNYVLGLNVSMPLQMIFRSVSI